MNKSAVISDCGTYRYSLSRGWDHSLPRVAFVMLNPSVADADVDDPTIRKCIGFAQRLGFGGFDVVNLYAYRATDPRDLKRAGYPVGEDNDDYIRISVFDGSDAVICAWGSHAKGLARPAEVLAMLRIWGRRPMALQINAGGIPAHPLMLPYSCRLQELKS
ncbi:MAG: DUF1643 domain-containing protein [Burkholderiaceae bacterium]